ncbi:MAG: hypothetical protein U5J97_06525 [Trueperaceae bacterium]|nr:hypothetical protein [Trueperaceae bacterium]
MTLIAISALVRLGPNVATIAIASRIPGNASKMSITHMISVSIQPPT